MNAPMTPDRLAEILARADAALPGPWCTDAWEIYQGTEYEAGAEWIGETARGVAGAADLEQDRATATFVAAARTDVPDLVAAVRLLMAERDGFRDQRNAVCADNEELLDRAERSGLARLQAENETRTVARERDALRARVAELEALLPAPVQTCQTCGAGYDYGKPCSVCEFKKRVIAVTSVEKDTPAGESTSQAAETEAYPGELAMLRGLLGVIRATATHGSDIGEVRRLLAEHASDEQAAYSDAAQLARVEDARHTLQQNRQGGAL